MVGRPSSTACTSNVRTCWSRPSYGLIPVTLSSVVSQEMMGSGMGRSPSFVSSIAYERAFWCPSAGTAPYTVTAVPAHYQRCSQRPQRCAPLKDSEIMETSPPGTRTRASGPGGIRPAAQLYVVWSEFRDFTGRGALAHSSHCCESPETTCMLAKAEIKVRNTGAQRRSLY